MASSLASALAPADLNAPNLYVFREGEPAVFPIATGLPGTLPEDRSGYQTAVSGQDAPPTPSKAKAPKAKRPTVQQIANQQVAMMDLMTAITNRLDALTKTQEHPPKPVQVQAGVPGPSATASLLQQHTGGAAPCQGPSSSCSLAARQGRHLASCIGGGELPAEGVSLLANAVMARAKSSLADGPGFHRPTARSTARFGVVSAGLSGPGKVAGGTPQSWGRLCRQSASTWRAGGLLPADQVGYMRFLERRGGQQTLGLVAWQVAQVLDFLEAEVEGAKDVASLLLLLLMLDQTCQDKGDATLGWLLTLQPDRSKPRATCPDRLCKAFPHWQTRSGPLAYIKELETIAGRRSEAAQKPSPAKPPPKHPNEPSSASADPPPALSRKQQRAAAWAAKKAEAPKK